MATAPTDNSTSPPPKRKDRIESLDAFRGFTILGMVFVIGSPTSSNANRLVEVARNAGARAHLIEGAHDIDPDWLEDVSAGGLTAGASTPETLVQEAIARLRELGCNRVEDLRTVEENVTFPLPRELRDEQPVSAP